MPVLRNDDFERASEASAMCPDPRAGHYWNPDKETARAASQALHITAELPEAWDVFLVFAPDAKWGSGEPMPAPAAWMLGGNDKDPRYITAQRLDQIVRALLQ